PAAIPRWQRSRKGAGQRERSAARHHPDAFAKNWTFIMMISTHVLDTARGCPAGRIPVELDVFITGQGWREVGSGLTNDEGRILDFGEPAAVGVYRLMFDVASYLPEAFFPSISITI